VKKQAFTVRFSDEAQMIGEPKSVGSSEDFRYVKSDTSASKRNSRRFILDLLQRGRTLAWDFAVINHNEGDFTVEHGVATIDDKDADLDVLPTFTTDRAQINLAGRIQRAIRLIIYIEIASLMKDFLPSRLFGALVGLTVPLFNIVIIWLLIILMREIMLIIPSLMEWWGSTGSPRDHISIDAGADSNIVVAPHGTASMRNIIPSEDALRAFLNGTDSRAAGETEATARTTTPSKLTD
jgi:hypothetical protein